MSVLGVSRRLRGKQFDPRALAVPQTLQSTNPITHGVSLAIQAEALACDGLLKLPLDTRRVNVHFTHVRTKSSKDLQPHQMTRPQFWQHLIRCFQEVYPDASSPTGCILQFGLVCKERHKDAAKWEDQSEHHHCACHASTHFRWRRIRKLSAEKYNVQLNAVAHETYTTMFRYLRTDSRKKGLHELDAQPYFSSEHPQGEDLKKLLELGEAYQQVRKAKKLAAEVEVPVRSQFGVFYKWVIEHKLRDSKGVKRMHADAVSELKAGRHQLLDFCKRHKSYLEDQINFCWELHDAPKALQRMEKSRLDLLLEAAHLEAPMQDLPSYCANSAGLCAQTYESILLYQNKLSVEFRHQLFQTLHLGRSQKGNAFMIVGGKDTGKTTLTQPVDAIYKCMQCPQSDSFCPLENIRGHEVLLWQDFRYNPGHPKREEQGMRLDEGTWNRLLEGLPTAIGVPKSDGSRSDFVYVEDTPIICTGPFMLMAYRNGVPDKVETDQLTARMKLWVFGMPASGNLDRAFKVCAHCWSRWLLAGEIEWQRCNRPQLDPFASKVADLMYPAGSSSSSALPPTAQVATGEPQTLASAASPCNVMTQLARLIEWKTSGLLSDTEFANAKLKLGL